MRYPASETLEILRLVEQLRLPAKRTLDKLGIPRATFNRWYDRILTGGVDAPRSSSAQMLESHSTRFPVGQHLTHFL